MMTMIRGFVLIRSPTMMEQIPHRSFFFNNDIYICTKIKLGPNHPTLIQNEWHNQSMLFCLIPGKNLFMDPPSMSGKGNSEDSKLN